MSVHYIVDGYNAIGRIRTFEAKTLLESRRRLCACLEERRPHGSRRNKMTVVFDGSVSVAGSREPWSFEVLYSIGTSADDVIEEMVRQAAQPKNCVVVTDDKGLRSVVRRSGAAVRTVADFFKGASAAQGQRSRYAACDTSALDIVAREKITQEMCRLWLKKR